MDARLSSTFHNTAPWSEPFFPSLGRGQSQTPLNVSLTFLLISLILIFHLIQTKLSRTGQLMSKIPGPVNLPLIGFAYVGLSLRPQTEVIAFLRNFSNKYGSIFGGFGFGKPYIYITSFKQASILLRSNEVIKPNDYDAIRGLIGDGILISNGDKWKSRRKLILPSINQQRLMKFTRVFNKQGKLLANCLRQDMKSSGGDSEDLWDLDPYMNRCLTDVSFECMIGRDVGAQMNRDSAFYKALNELFDLNGKKMWQPWNKFKPIWKLSGNEEIEKGCLDTIQSYFDKILEEQRHLKKNQRTSPENVENGDNVLLDILMDAASQERLSDRDLYDETLTMVMGARDTSARTIVSLLFFLAKNPSCQEQVFKEISDVCGTDDEITMKQGMEMCYTECCIKEALRLNPVFPILGRELQQELDVGGGMILPKGSVCTIVAAMIHRDPELYPDPDAFKPERFLDSTDATTDPYGFLGFSAGRRNCIGMKFAMLNIKIILVHLLRQFEIGCGPSQDVKFTMDLLLKPVRPITFTLKLRELQ